MPLSFDEFNAISNRERNRKKSLSATGADDSSSKSNGTDSSADASDAASQPKPSVFNGLGDLMESHQMQSLFIFLIMLDFVVCYLDLALRLVAAQDNTIFIAASIGDVSFYRRLFSSFGSFTIFVFAFELILMLFAFGFSYLKHLGYLLDLVIISIEIYCDLNGVGREIRLINLLRLWRIARLSSYFVMIEKISHEDTKIELEESKATNAKLGTEMNNLKDEFKKEHETRKSVEIMLQSYRDEVDTLNEALKIAAMDIADIGGDDDDDDDDLGDDDDINGSDDDIVVGDEEYRYSDEDEYGSRSQATGQSSRSGRSQADQGTEEDDFKDAISSEFDPAIKREKMMQLVQSDTMSLRSNRTGRSSMSSSRGNGGRRNNSVKFVIGEDGSVSKM